MQNYRKKRQVATLLPFFCMVSDIGVVDMADMRQWREQARRVNPSTLNPTKRYKGAPHHHIPENKYKCNGKRTSALTICLHFPAFALLSKSLFFVRNVNGDLLPFLFSHVSNPVTHE